MVCFMLSWCLVTQDFPCRTGEFVVKVDVVLGGVGGG